MTNRDSIYVLRQPTRSFLSVVLVRTDLGLPLTEKVHEAIDQLEDFSDVIFVFSDRYKHTDLDMEYFSNLYGAVAYVCSEKEEALTVPVLEAIRYSIEIWENQHVALLYSDTFKLAEGLPVTKEKVLEITLAQVAGPIMKVERMSSKELGEIYIRQVPEQHSTRSWWGEKKEISTITVKERYWSKWKTDSKIVYWKIQTISQLLKVLWNEKPEYVKSFVEDDLGFFWASSVKTAGIKFLNANIENVQAKGQKQ